MGFAGGGLWPLRQNNPLVCFAVRPRARLTIDWLTSTKLSCFAAESGLIELLSFKISAHEILKIHVTFLPFERQ